MTYYMPLLFQNLEWFKLFLLYLLLCYILTLFSLLPLIKISYILQQHSTSSFTQQSLFYILQHFLFLHAHFSFYFLPYFIFNNILFLHDECFCLHSQLTKTKLSCIASLNLVFCFCVVVNYFCFTSFSFSYYVCNNFYFYIIGNIFMQILFYLFLHT